MDHRNLLAPGRALAAAAPAPALPLAPLLAAALALAACGLAACQRQAQDASAIPHTPIPKAEARLSIAADGGRIRYEGLVADTAARDRVEQALRSAAPEAAGSLAIDPQTRPAAWTPGLGPATAALRRTDGRLAFAGRRIELDGDLTQEQRATLHRRIRRLYPGYELAGSFQGVDPRHALPDEGDTAGLLAFLEARPIAFQPGTGMLTQASVGALARAARGLQAAGPAARVEIRVHPEADGDDAEQQAVARQRADALLTQLALRGVAPGRIRATVAAPADARKDRIVGFAPWQAETTTAGDVPAAESDALRAETADEGDEAPADGAQSRQQPETTD